MTLDEAIAQASRLFDETVARRLEELEAKLRQQQRLGNVPVLEYPDGPRAVTVNEFIAAHREELGGWKQRMLQDIRAEFERPVIR